MYLSTYIYITLAKYNERSHIKFYEDIKGELQKQLSIEKIDIDDKEDQG